MCCGHWKCLLTDSCLLTREAYLIEKLYHSTKNYRPCTPQGIKKRIKRPFEPILKTDRALVFTVMTIIVKPSHDYDESYFRVNASIRKMHQH